MGIGWQIVWVVCGVATVVAAVPAVHHRWARYLGRAATGVLFVIGGALVHVTNLVTGVDYTGFADPAHFWWVTQAWHAVVAPHQVLFIGLLAVFECAAGILVVVGGRRTQLGYAAVIGFYLALWLFGWYETVWCIVLLPAMMLLLRAERQAVAIAPQIAGRPAARVGS